MKKSLIVEINAGQRPRTDVDEFDIRLLETKIRLAKVRQEKE